MHDCITESGEPEEDDTDMVVKGQNRAHWLGKIPGSSHTERLCLHLES